MLTFIATISIGALLGGQPRLMPLQGKDSGASQAAERAIVKRVTVAAPPSQVWRAWTTREGVREFLGADANIEMKFGGRYEILFSTEPPVGAQGSEGCQVLSFVPQRMLSFTWNAPPTQPAMRNHRTFVVLTLEERGKGTQFELRHAGWGTGADWDKAYEYFDRAWESVVSMLAKRLAEGPLGSTPKSQPGSQPEPKKNLEALEKLGELIGGVWRGEVKSNGGPLVVEFTYKRHPDGKGVIGEGVIGKGSKTPMFVTSQFGWDPVAKAVYYFDTHDSETLYFGHVSVEKNDLIFTFSPVGALSRVFQSRSRLNGDVMENIIRDREGKEIVGLTLRR